MGAPSYFAAPYDAARGIYDSTAQTLGDTLTAGQRGIEYARGTIAAYFPSWSEITKGVATIRSVAELGIALNLNQGPFLAGIAWGVGTKLIPDDMTATQRRIFNTLSSTMFMQFLAYEEFYYGLRDGLIEELTEIPELVALVRSGEIITMLTTALQELTASVGRAFNFGSVIGESLFADIFDALDNEDYARTATMIGKFLGPMLLELLIALVTVGSSIVGQGGRIIGQKIIEQSSKVAKKLLSSGRELARRINAPPPPKALVDKRMGELSLADTSGGDLSLAKAGGGELATVAVAETPKPQNVAFKLADLDETPVKPKPASAATAKPAPAPAPIATQADPDKALPKPFKEPGVPDHLKDAAELIDGHVTVKNLPIHVPQPANDPVSLPKAVADGPIGLLTGPTAASLPIPPVDKGLADAPISPLARGLEPAPLPTRRPDLHQLFATLAPEQWARLQPWQARSVVATFDEVPKLMPDAETVRELIMIYRSWQPGRPEMNAIAATGELTILHRLARSKVVGKIGMIASRSGQRTPDFVCILADDTEITIEVRTLTGTGKVLQGGVRPRVFDETMSYERFLVEFPKSNATQDRIREAIRDKFRRDQIGAFNSQGYVALVVDQATDAGLLSAEFQDSIRQMLAGRPHIFGVRILIGETVDAFIPIDNPSVSFNHPF